MEAAFVSLIGNTITHGLILGIVGSVGVWSPSLCMALAGFIP